MWETRLCALVNLSCQTGIPYRLILYLLNESVLKDYLYFQTDVTSDCQTDCIFCHSDQDVF